ncbi:MAG: alpha/beta hydrolase [Burkholderiales bacterium]|jgi:predicted alpha/beta hydrolase family esterase|nr:alpha/beta hydrolase [Burkholderiales bacterium]
MNSLHTLHDRRAPGAGHPRLVIVPGLHGSGAEHWQSWLHGQVAGSVRVEQDAWSTPDLEHWSERVADTVTALGAGPHVIVAHSFGCLATVRALAKRPTLDIAQLLLVAPAEPDRFDVAGALPQARLDARSCVVASDDDPWMSATQAHAWALRWGSDWINLGNAGHINVDSGYGPFPLAREWATDALGRLDARPWRRAA